MTSHETFLAQAPTQNNEQSPHKDMIVFDELTVKYKKHTALSHLSGSIQQGSLTAVVGPNGGGKSTFLKTIMGLLSPASGAMIYKDLDTQRIAYLPQLSEVDRSFPLTVEEVVALGITQSAGFYKAIGPEHKEAIHKALCAVGLGDCANRSLNTLSGGQFQRMLFARLWIQDSSFIMLDEPFAAIDTYTIEDLISIILNWHQMGKTIIVVSHDLDLVRDFFPESMIIARKCLAWGNTKDVITAENLKIAKNLSRNWESCIKSSASEEFSGLRGF